MIDFLLEPMAYDFMWRALVVVIAASVAGALLSCWLAHMGWALMGDAVSHAVLPGVAVASILGFPFAIGALLAALVAVALIGVAVAGAGFTPLPATIASSWMLLNLAPFEFGGTDLGLVPALPSMALFAAVAWRIRREVSGPVSIRDVRTMAAVFLGVPVALTVVAWLMLWDASGVLRIEAPFFPAAIASTVVIHAAALVAGMGPRLSRALLRRRAWPEWPLASLRLAASYVGWLWAAGAVAVVVSLIWHHASVRETLGIADGVGALTGLLLLSLAYLPNIAFAAAGILVGAPANVGVAEAGLFAVSPGTLPPLPTLAAMPQSHLSPAFGVLLAVPVAIAVWCVHRHLKKGESDRPYVEVVLAAVIAGVLFAVLALLMGGELGQYGRSGVNWWFAGVLASVWLAVPGAVVAVMVAGLPGAGPVEAPALERDDVDVPAETADADEGAREDEDADDDIDDAEGAEREVSDADDEGESDESEDTDESDEPDDAEEVEEEETAETEEADAASDSAADADTVVDESAGDVVKPEGDADSDSDADADAADPEPEPDAGDSSRS